MNQREKIAVRHTKEWKEHREKVADEFDRRDPITLKPLRKGWNCHHMDQDSNHYANFDMMKEQDYRFLPLNKATHDLIHVIYRYARKDSKFMVRLIQYVAMMMRINE